MCMACCLTVPLCPTADSCAVVIRAALPATANSINLAEVELFDLAGIRIPTDQLQLSMSSIFNASSEYSPFTCNDGNIGSFCSSGNAYDGLDLQPWLRIQYSCPTGETSLSHVVVVNRFGCCYERIMDYKLEFVNAAGVVDRPSYRFASADERYNITAQASSGLVFAPPPPMIPAGAGMLVPQEYRLNSQPAAMSCCYVYVRARTVFDCVLLLVQALHTWDNCLNALSA